MVSRLPFREPLSETGSSLAYLLPQDSQLFC